jgi:hypothetical protein
VLDVVHAGVVAVVLEQLLMAATLDDPAITQHENLISPADRGQTMGDDQTRPSRRRSGGE